MDNKERKDWLIGQYITDYIDQEEKKDFDRLFEEDEDFRINLEFQKELQSVLNSDAQKGFDDLRSNLEKLGNEFGEQNKKTKKLNFNQFIKIAASVVLLIGVFVILYFYSSPTLDSNLQAYQNAYKTYQIPGNLRSVESDKTELNITLNNAAKAYKNKNFKEAISGFEAVLAIKPDQFDVLFYSAIAYMENQEFGKAIVALSNLIENESHPFVIQSKWYLALCYIHEKQIAKAKLLLNEISENEGFYKSQALKLLENI